MGLMYAAGYKERFVSERFLIEPLGYLTGIFAVPVFRIRHIRWPVARRRLSPGRASKRLLPGAPEFSIFRRVDRAVFTLEFFLSLCNDRIPIVTEFMILMPGTFAMLKREEPELYATLNR